MGLRFSVREFILAYLYENPSTLGEIMAAYERAAEAGAVYSHDKEMVPWVLDGLVRRGEVEEDGGVYRVNRYALGTEAYRRLAWMHRALLSIMRGD